MNILKKWFWQWLDKNHDKLLGSYIRDVIREEFNSVDKTAVIREWVEKEAVSSVHYTHFIDAVANNAVLTNALVKSINDKQLNRGI